MQQCRPCQHNESGNNGNPGPDSRPRPRDYIRWLARQSTGRRDLNRRNEAVTASRNRLDVSRTIRFIAENHSYLVDTEIDAAIEVDKRALSPDTLLNFLAAYDFSGTLREHEQ